MSPWYRRITLRKRSKSCQIVFESRLQQYPQVPNQKLHFLMTQWSQYENIFTIIYISTSRSL